MKLAGTYLFTRYFQMLNQLRKPFEIIRFIRDYQLLHFLVVNRHDEEVLQPIVKGQLIPTESVDGSFHVNWVLLVEYLKSNV
tara:strand:+ start:367 stop:612 length:246 start_codon:yes stop_codon:yes gene_type:complete